jgi:3-methyl-2-oxobutanoate hydroxymethyltransferase
VRLGVKKSLMVVDMPYNTYRNSKEALKNARLVMKKTNCDAVKLEGGKKIISIVKTLVKNNIPVMGHLGILPQTEKKFTYKGKKLIERNRILKDAKLLEDAGIFSVVLECIETKLAKKITEQLNIITVGIGSSANCDGQVLVMDDLIGLSQSKFRFVKKYVNISKIINSAVKKYKSEVLNKQFPKAKHSFKN